MLNLRISIYNGIRFFSFIVDGEKIGHRVGEFAPTRKIPIFPKKKKINGAKKSSNRSSSWYS